MTILRLRPSIWRRSITSSSPSRLTGWSASSTSQAYQYDLTGNRTRLMPPIADFWEQLDGRAQAAIADFLAVGVIGGPDTVRQGLQKLADETQADEFMLVSDVYDADLRLRSLEITAGAMNTP